MEDIIEVDIDCTQGKYEKRVYINNNNCYLAQALKRKGYPDVIVGAEGNCLINDIPYKASNFTATDVRMAFNSKSVMHVKLTKV